jgi:gluconokinase
VAKSLTLALDIGTSSIRASLFDENAAALPRANVKIPTSFISTANGGFEIDAKEAFAKVVAAIDAILDKTRNLRGEIEYVAPCAFWHSLVGINAKGRPTTSVLGWADTRSRDYTAVLRKRFDEVEIHNRTGARFHSSYWPAKLLWFRREHPQLFEKTAQWLSFSDYVWLKLFGNATTSVSMASGTGVFDIRKCEWDRDLLRFLKLGPNKLPLIAENDAATSRLDRKFAKRWPRLAGAEWFPAIGDGAADNIGSRCVTRSRAALMIGTSAAMRVSYVGKPPARIPDGLWCYRVDGKRIILGGALSDGGGLYRWLNDNLRLPADAEAQIANRRPAIQGLTFLPFLAGERGTGYHEDVAGAILGLKSGHTALDILQAAMESVAFRLAAILEQLNKIAPIKEIVASGGALRDSPVWAQIIADVLGRDLIMSGTDESSSRGAVLHALESKGKIGSINSNSVTGVGLIVANETRFKAFYEARKPHAEFYKLLVKRGE